MSETTSPAEKFTVTDPGALYVYSGLIDALRDMTGDLANKGVAVDPASTSHLLSQYAELREAIQCSVSAEAATQIQRLAPELNSDTTVVGIHTTTTLLSRFLDLVHQAPAFVAQHRVMLAGAAKVNDDLDKVEVIASAELEVGSVEVVGASAYDASSAYL